MPIPNKEATSISGQLRWIKINLDNWAKSEGGIAEIAHDTNHMWELAFNTSQVPRCIICFQGENLRGDFGIAAVMSRVDRHFVVLVTRARGYTANRGDTLYKDVGINRPFVDLLEEARDIIRVINFDPSVTEANGNDPIDFRGISPALPDDYPLDAYLIEFSIGTQLPQALSNNQP